MHTTEQAPANTSTLNPVARAVRAAGGVLRRDWLVIVLLALGTMVMTYPVIFELNQGVIGHSGDALSVMWQDWWLRETLIKRHSLIYTNLIFYPTGTSTALVGRRWATLPIWWPLSMAFGDVAAENLTLLIGLVMSGYFAYLLGLYLTRKRGAAWFGGAVFAFLPFHVYQLSQPNLGHLEWLPAFMLAFVHSLRTRKAMHVLLAALALSMVTMTHPRLTVLAVLAGATYGLYHLLSTGQWRSRRMWASLALFAVLATAFNLPPALPYLRLPSEQIDFVVEKGRQQLSGGGTDLIGYACPPPRNRLLNPVTQRMRRAWNGLFEQGPGGRLFPRLQPEGINCQAARYNLYLGVIATALVATGLALGKPREWLPWALMATLFMSLAFGPTLHISGKPFPGVWMPYRALVANPLFAAMRTPMRYNLGLALPWAMLAAYGAAQILARLRPSRAQVLIVVLTGLTLAEYWIGPISRKSTEVPSYYYQLASEPDDFAIIDLPMGRLQSRQHMLAQMVHGKPIADGMVPRQPASLYEYIESNTVLAAWREAEPLPCDPVEYEEALSALLDDGFRYVIVHRQDPDFEPLESYFQAEPIHQDSDVAVYRLVDLEAASLPESAPCR